MRMPEDTATVTQITGAAAARWDDGAMRLFVAVRPPERVLAHLAAATEAVRGPQAGPPALRWTPPEQQHITLAFYGEVPDGAAEDLAAGLADVVAAAPAPTLQLVGAGAFSGRTLWAGVRAADPAGLVDLMAAVDALGDAVGAPHEPRDRRRAHLTLARVGTRSRRGVDLAGIVHALSVYAGPEWTAGRVELVASQLGKGRGGGPLHDVLAALPFAPGR